jgi:hypothetical protein
MQHRARLAGKDAHLVLVGMKSKSRTGPAGHLSIIHRPATRRPVRQASSAMLTITGTRSWTVRSPSDASPDGGDHLARQPFCLFIVCV